jgi:hypothetical protein
MQNKMLVSIIVLLGILISPRITWAQKGAAPPAGWRACPRCQTSQDRREARDKYKIDGHAFDPHDLTGIWGYDGISLDHKAVPPLTPWGQEQWAATKGDFGLNTKDGMLRCDPLGYPRWFTYNYGTQFLMQPERVLQFFEWGHTWRDIWTDGRKLPDAPPEDRWLGWSVGRWEGDEFVVESTGYDERSWLQEDFRDRQWGWPHSSELRVVERYKRTSYGTMDVTLTIIDPKTFTKPWVTKGSMLLQAGTELWEYFCVPSDSQEYNSRVMLPAVGAEKK